MSGRNALATVMGLTVLAAMSGAVAADPIASPTLGVGNVVDIDNIGNVDAGPINVSDINVDQVDIGQISNDVPFGDMNMVEQTDLANIATGVSQSQLMLNDVDNNADNHHNTIAAGSGQINNGAISGNIVERNRGITAFMANTGNQVNFNNATILNVYMSDTDAGP